MDSSELLVILQNSFPSAITAVGSIVGSLITMIFLRNNTAVNEFEMIKAGLFKEAAEELLKNGKMTYTEFYKANNFLKVAQLADEYYKDSDKRDSNKIYDFDWFLRFYENVGNISDQHMQEIWAKILAGEISNPGTHSIHLLEILKYLSKKDAELFEKVCSVSLDISNQVLLPNFKQYLDEFGISYDDILRLNELNLINSNGMLSLSLKVPPQKAELCRGNSSRIAVQSLSNNSVDFSINEFPFTSVGSELRSILTIKIPDKCLELLITELSKNKGISLELLKLS